MPILKENTTEVAVLGVETFFARCVKTYLDRNKIQGSTNKVFMVKISFSKVREN